MNISRSSEQTSPSSLDRRNFIVYSWTRGRQCGVAHLSELAELGGSKCCTLAAMALVTCERLENISRIHAGTALASRCVSSVRSDFEPFTPVCPTRPRQKLRIAKTGDDTNVTEIRRHLSFAFRSRILLQLSRMIRFNFVLLGCNSIRQIC